MSDSSISTFPPKKTNSHLFLLLLVIFCALAATASAAEVPFPFSSIDSDWGGHLKSGGSVSSYDETSIFSVVGAGDYFDGFGNLRLKNNTFFGASIGFDIHYEAVMSGGDTREKRDELARQVPGSAFFESDHVNDDRRLMDLTGIVDETDDLIIYHRLDRLSLTVQAEPVSLCLGRQALTWGNGMLFNPMDLFNPFSPTEIDRDYKIGDDMVTLQIPMADLGELQLLYVPRRSLATRTVRGDQSSTAGKFHFMLGSREFDFMAARHYNDFVTGVGGTGYILEAAWRMDVMVTFPEHQKNRNDFVSLVGNIDYSWIWSGHNMYGFVEVFFNGLGKTCYGEAITDPEIVSRLTRGELFTVGRRYLAGGVQLEVHPLLHLYLTTINNLKDPSGIIQPKIAWDVAQNLQMTLGGTVYYGSSNTEFGGYLLPGTTLYQTPADSLFLKLAYFF